jgi:hypothetical protein
MAMKKIKPLLYIIVFLAIAALIGFAIRASLAPRIPKDWAYYTDSQTGASFRYPANLIVSLSNPVKTQYVRLLDWPPHLQVLDEKFACTEGGSEIAPAVQTKQENVDGKTYCITKETEGAAGSIYTMYAYSFSPTHSTGSEQAKTYILTFSTQAPQCANYEEPQKTACESERAELDLDSIVNLIAKSAK